MVEYKNRNVFDRWFLNIGLEYSPEGEKGKTINGVSNLFYNDYLKLPVLFKYYFKLNNRELRYRKLAFIGGITFNYAINSNVIINHPDTHNIMKRLSDNFNPFDIGITAGGTWRILPRIELYAKLEKGLLPIYKNQKSNPTNAMATFGINWFLTY